MRIRGKGKPGTKQEKSDTLFRAYLHVAASMTGNLGKFSTEPAADGWRDKDEKARERMRDETE